MSLKEIFRRKYSIAYANSLIEMLDEWSVSMKRNASLRFLKRSLILAETRLSNL